MWELSEPTRVSRLYSLTHGVRAAGDAQETDANAPGSRGQCPPITAQDGEHAHQRLQCLLFLLVLLLQLLLEKKRGRGQHGGNRSGRGHKGERQRGNRPRLGFEGGQTPFYLAIPKYGYNEGHSRRAQYQPLTLNRLQYLIDLGRIDPTQPIDLTQLVNGRGVTIQPQKRDYGVQLVGEGAGIFAAKVNIEVQMASEEAIAAIERNGGIVTTGFYDPRSLAVLCKPVPFFLSGQPIPKRMLPGEDMVPYYTDAANRGYLADPEKIQKERIALAQKYGYVLPDISKDELFHMLFMRKDPRQIFFGLSPGWVVNMTEKKILKPTDDKLLQYYNS